MHLLFALVVLFAAGLPLAYVATRNVVIALVASPLVTGIMCSLAVMAMLVVGGPLAVWLVLMMLAQVGTAWWLWSRSAFRVFPVDVWDVLILFGPLLVPFLAVTKPPVGWDARSIWWLHALWFKAGGSAAAGAMTNPVFSFAHADYPPLSSSTVAGVWTMSGSSSLRIAQVISSMLTLCALALLAYAVRQLTGRRSPWVARLAGVFTAMAAWTMGSLVIAGGYVDHLWSAAVAAAAVLLLTDATVVRDDETSPFGLALVLLAVAALTKNEGFAAAILVAALFTLRARHQLRRFGWVWLPVAAGLAWALVARHVGAQSDLAQSATLGQLRAGDFSSTSRLSPTLDRLLPLIRPLLDGSLVVLVLGTLLLRRARRRLGLGSSAWLWVLIAAYTGVLLVVYMISPHDLEWHLNTSLDRVTVALILFLAADTASWLVTAATVVRGEDVLEIDDERAEAPVGEPEPLATR